ncbi:MAG: twin-arginine translocation signal domain-containing protein [Syntrophotaleaceae bacterium]
MSAPPSQPTATRLSRRRFLTAGIGVAGGLFLGQACWYEPRTPVVEEHRLTIA